MRPRARIKLVFFGALLAVLLVSFPQSVRWLEKTFRPSVRAPASTLADTAGDTNDETAPPLLDLDPSLLVTVTNSPASAQQKIAPSDALVAAGTRLIAVIDNDCLERRYQERQPGNSSLSEKAYEVSEKEEIAGLKMQAYPFTAERTTAVAELSALAQADSCIRQITNERVRRLHGVARFSVNDPSLTMQAHLSFLKARTAWDFFFASGRSVTKDSVVAVIDSGVDSSHEDLAGNMWRDSAGKPGYDFVNADSDPNDDLDHGTHVAGLIAAVANNNKGGSGVIGKRIKIMAIKVISGEDEGTLSDLINGIRFAADNGADVINLSLGGPDSSSAERDALQYAIKKGVVVIAAAGNDDKQLTANSNDYPAGYAASLPGLIAVGSIDSDTGKRSSFSNFSTEHVQIAAPGAENSGTQRGLLSTIPGGGYKRYLGTSMSAPLVAGAAALVTTVMKSEGLPASPTAVIELLQQSARLDPNLATDFKNGAVLDLERLARAVKYRFIVTGDAGAEE